MAGAFELAQAGGGNYLRVNLLRGVKHVFGTRRMGKKDLEVLGIPPVRLLTLKQVHGGDCLVYRGDGLPFEKPQPYDAVITDQNGVALGIWTADCLPILIYDRQKRVIAAIHAGWRGIWRGVIGRTIKEMAENFGSDPADLLVGIGPGIAACCYEVKEDVAKIFQKIFQMKSDIEVPLIEMRQGRSFLDLGRAARLELFKAGVLSENVQVIPLCTSCRQELFYSYRRDGKTGRQLSFIML